MRRVFRIASRWSGKRRRHLGRGLEVEVVRLELQAAGRVEVGGGADAEQHVVGLVLGPANVVEVVGDDQREVQLGGETEQLLVEPPLLGQAVVLQLEEEPVFSEDLRVAARDRAREVPVLDLQGARDLAVEAGGLRPISPSLCFARCSRSIRGL